MASRLSLLPLVLLAAGACADGNLSQPSDPLAPYTGLEPEPLACVPNLDGVIEAHELAPTLGQLATYRVTPALSAGAAPIYPVDLDGIIDDDGGRVWDWSETEETDQVAELSARTLGDQWYAAHFPSGTFAVAADAGGRVDAVYSHGETGLLLYGVASAEEDPPEGKTLLVYEDPITFFPFPFELGSTWSEVGEVRDGWLLGLHPWSQDDHYEVSVDAAGELRLPDFTFHQALRVYSKVTIYPKTGLVEGTTQHQHSFVFECFGEVARATSAVVLDSEDDPGKLFDTAAEIRRLGWF